ncbi:MAG TPA: RNA polymerase sigma factor RpoD/SigA [Draconibacterium sp.]|nr:RNA polymerase sigma factor RpoD/SigA [Draconibacterium sp.]
MRALKISTQITNRESVTLDMYLSEISKTAILSTEQEVELAGRVADGDSGALGELVKANLRFVVSVAKQYQNHGIKLVDLINEGNLGLIKAAQRFDKTRGFKFITYAVWWIRQAIMQAIAENSRIVRLPVHKIGLKNKISKAVNQLSHEFFREPTTEELSESLEMQPVVIEEGINYLNTHYMSMDAPIGEGNESMSDLMLNEDYPSPESGLIKNSLSTDIERLLKTLKPRDANILRYFYGLNGYAAQPIDKIGDDFGLTRERVRQIKERSLEKLKNHNFSSQMLKEYINI